MLCVLRSTSDRSPEPAQEASTHLITPEQARAAAQRAGADAARLSLPRAAVLTFNRPVIDRLAETCALQPAEWLGPAHHPYAAPQAVWRGDHRGLPVTVIVPPMGASPLACVLEDLAASGVQLALLVCAAWSLGPPVRFGDLIVPQFTLGPDGTSVHYGNVSGRAEAQPHVAQALAAAALRETDRVHVGGNGTCEALYRITPQLARDLRRQGCLSMDNGEAATMFCVAPAVGMMGGVLFQPYIDLTRGWDPARLGAAYAAAAARQADAALAACCHLVDHGR